MNVYFVQSNRHLGEEHVNQPAQTIPTKHQRGDTTFQVVLNGLRPNVSETEARTKLAALFKATPEQINYLLATPGYVVKKGNTAELASKYKTAIESAGGICEVIPEETQVIPFDIDLPHSKPPMLEEKRTKSSVVAPENSMRGASQVGSDVKMSALNVSKPVEEKIWWYAKSDKRFGPYSGSELKLIAAGGDLISTDLVWKEGLANWVPASSLKGMFSLTAAEIPPPLPTDALDETPDIVNPALWNPIALSNWSLFLTPIFGTYLVTENYKAMGKKHEAKESLSWFYASIGAILLGWVLIPIFGDYGFITWIVVYLIYFIIWNFRSASKQNKYILSVYGNKYTRQPWGKVLVIATAAMIAYQIATKLLW